MQHSSPGDLRFIKIQSIKLRILVPFYMNFHDLDVSISQSVRFSRLGVSGMVIQNYFIQFQRSQLKSGAKTENPRDNHLAFPQTELTETFLAVQSLFIALWDSLYRAFLRQRRHGLHSRIWLKRDSNQLLKSAHPANFFKVFKTFSLLSFSAAQEMLRYFVLINDV